MKYVIDSCTAFKWFLTEQESDEARLLRDSFRNQLADLIAPDIFPIEIVHALTRAERQKRITPLEGAELVEDLFQVLPILYTSLPLLPRAYELSSRVRIGVYDCLYVALAEREGCSLVTTDQRLITIFPALRLFPSGRYDLRRLDSSCDDRDSRTCFGERPTGAAVADLKR